MLLNYLRHFPLDFGKSYLAKRVELNSCPTPVAYTNSMGLTFELDLNEYQMKQIYLFDQYEKNTIQHLIRLCKTPKVIMDVGANIGFYALTLAKKFPMAHVYAFEPHPISFQRLLKNSDMNPSVKIIPVQRGLSDRCETLTLAYETSNMGAASIFQTHASHTQNIELMTLDTFCEENNIRSIDLLKLDIEGAELKFLNGAQRTLEQSSKMILVVEMIDENCVRGGYTSEILFDRIQSMGFKAYIPKAWPFAMKPIKKLPSNYLDNILFLKGYD